MASQTPTDAHAIALLALATAVSDERRAQRFLAVSGMDAEGLRIRAADPAVLAAVLRSLEAFEPDLIDVAEQMGVAPSLLVGARRRLEEEEE